MGTIKKMWAVTDRKDGKPRFHRFMNGPCPMCGRRECLPDHPHGPGKFYHVDLQRFLSWIEIEALNGINGHGSDLSKIPTDRMALARQEERRRKTKERNRRYRREKRQRHVLNPQQSDL